MQLTQNELTKIVTSRAFARKLADVAREVATRGGCSSFQVTTGNDQRLTYSDVITEFQTDLLDDYELHTEEEGRYWLQTPKDGDCLLVDVSIGALDMELLCEQLHLVVHDYNNTQGIAPIYARGQLNRRRHGTLLFAQSALPAGRSYNTGVLDDLVETAKFCQFHHVDEMAEFLNVPGCLRCSSADFTFSTHGGAHLVDRRVLSRFRYDTVERE